MVSLSYGMAGNIIVREGKGSGSNKKQNEIAKIAKRKHENEAYVNENVAVSAKNDERRQKEESIIRERKYQWRRKA